MNVLRYLRSPGEALLLLSDVQEGLHAVMLSLRAQKCHCRPAGQQL